MLQLILNAPHEAFITEGPMPLTLRLSNQGGEPQNVPPPGGSSPFEYRIYLGDAWIATASVREVLISRGLARTFVAIPAPRRLSPDASQDYTEDLAPLLASPLPPGQYELEARHLPSRTADLILSKRVPFEITALQPEAIIQTLDGPFIAAFEFLKRDAGHMILRQRSSLLSLNDPFNEIHTFTPSDSLGDTAFAVPVEPGQPLYWRWLAWLDGNSLHAGVAQITSLTYDTGPVPIQLDSPSLLPYGYGFPDGRGLFILSGFEGDDRRIQIVTLLPERGHPPLFTRVHLSHVPKILFSTTLNLPDGGPAEILLSWILLAGARSGVAQGAVDAATGEVKTKPRSIFVTRREVAAHSFLPMHRAGEPGVHQFLLAPEAPHGSYTLLRMGADDVSRRDEIDLPSTSVFRGHLIDRWVLPSPASAQPVVAALSGGKIWVSQGNDWRQLEAANVLISTVRLWTVATGQLWCTWFDAAHGYRRSRIAC